VGTVPIVDDAVITIWSDIGCPWAHLAVHRLHRARRELDLEDEVRLDHRPFPLELLNRRATPWPTLSGEVAVLQDVEPDAGWQAWAAPAWQWPVTTLPALEAVQAARRQGARAAERLDLGLRRAFFAESRCIALRHEILGVAARCDLDVDTLALALDRGVARRDVIESWRAAERDDAVRGSPHVFLPDGTSAHNPGIRMHWPGDEGEGEPIVDADDPSVTRDLVARAAGERA
jgi:predicted DsbA family dithiol-disulfide isomerase